MEWRGEEVMLLLFTFILREISLCFCCVVARYVSLRLRLHSFALFVFTFNYIVVIVAVSKFKIIQDF